MLSPICFTLLAGLFSFQFLSTLEFLVYVFISCIYDLICNLDLNIIIDLHNVSAVNYVAVSEALGVSPSVLAAGLAADNVICAVYFTSLFALASRIPPEVSTTVNGGYILLTIFFTHAYKCRTL